MAGKNMGLKAGDVVRFKSGGPLMTVSIIQGEEVWCEWFDAQGNYTSRAFREVVLEKVD